MECALATEPRVSDALLGTFFLRQSVARLRFPPVGVRQLKMSPAHRAVPPQLVTDSGAKSPVHGYLGTLNSCQLAKPPQLDAGSYIR